MDIVHRARRIRSNEDVEGRSRSERRVCATLFEGGRTWAAMKSVRLHKCEQVDCTYCYGYRRGVTIRGSDQKEVPVIGTLHVQRISTMGACLHCEEIGSKSSWNISGYIVLKARRAIIPFEYALICNSFCATEVHI